MAISIPTHSFETKRRAAGAQLSSWSCFGAAASLASMVLCFMMASECVFVVNPRGSNEDDYLTFRKIDYWHGMVGDQPMCQMYGDERNYAADELISAYRGCTVHCVTYPQRLWRRRRLAQRREPLCGRRLIWKTSSCDADSTVAFGAVDGARSKSP